MIVVGLSPVGLKDRMYMSCVWYVWQSSKSLTVTINLRISTTKRSSSAEKLAENLIITVFLVKSPQDWKDFFKVI